MKDDLEKQFPKTVDQAVETLDGILTFAERTRIANMSEKRLIDLSLSLGAYIRTEFRLWEGNTDLMDSCREVSGQQEITGDQAAYIIIMELWERLQKSDVLKVVK